MPVMQRVLRAEIAQDSVSDASGNLDAVAAVGEQPAESTDDGVHRLPAKRRQAIDQHNVEAELRSLDGGRHAGNAGADHANVG